MLLSSGAEAQNIFQSQLIGDLGIIVSLDELLCYFFISMDS